MPAGQRYDAGLLRIGEWAMAEAIDAPRAATHAGVLNGPPHTVLN